jgi:hypothetical protein
MGDFNASRNNNFLEYVLNFCSDENLCMYDKEVLPDDTFTYEHVGRGSRSWIDHVAINQRLCSLITDCGVLYDYVLSDHFPLYIVLNLSTICNATAVNENIKCNNIAIHYNWNEFSNESRAMCVEFLSRKLLSVQCPALIDVIKMNDVNRKKCVSDYYNELVMCLKEVCRLFVPVKSVKPVRRYVSGWNEQVAMLHNDARLAYVEWREAGRPRQGAAFELMSITRRKCKSRLRYIRRNKLRLNADRLAVKLASNDVLGFWSDMKKSDNCGIMNVTEQLDGVKGSVNVVNLWKEKYKSLYSKYCEPENNLLHDDHPRDNSFVITDLMVNQGIGKLKCKFDVGDEGIPVELLKMLPENCIKKLTDLLNLFIICGYVPDNLVKGTLVPIVKDPRGNLCSSDNYRCIAIVGTLSKLFELVLLEYMSNKITISMPQFGFKKGCSTDMCCDIFKRTVSLFRDEGSYMFACFVDLRKAFDMVNFWKLFDMLLSLGVDKSIVRVLCSMYTSQRMRIRWDGILSEDFACKNGVRQGSPLSPFLFSVYIDGVLKELMNVNSGCRIGGQVLNCLAYADDIVLFAPSWRGLQVIMDKLSELLCNINMEVNCVKTKCMVFAPKYSHYRFLNVIPKFKLGSVELEFCDKFRYLGHIICNTLDDKEDVNRELRLLFFRYNRLVKKFSLCSCEVKKLLWQSFVNCLYGCGIWNVSSSVLQLFIRGYNLCVKKFFGFMKYDRNRDVYFQLGLTSPMTLILNARYRSRCNLSSLALKFAWLNVLLVV